MSRHLIIMAAGTGGHIMPGLAVAREMLSRGWTVSWLGTKHGMVGTLTGAFKLLGAFWQCRKIFAKRKPDAVLGMGGYVCYPGGKVAALKSIPLVLVNADAQLLLSNRKLLSSANAVCFGFEGPDVKLARNGIVTGNPVRGDIAAIPVPLSRFADREGPLRILVVGGSLGAKALNEVVPQALQLIALESRPIVTHQAGEKNLSEVQAAYAKAQVQADIVPFIDNMAAQMKACDLMICRSGAITVSELCAAGVASILVPFVASTTDHQVGNAKWLTEAGAAIHLPQSELTAERLANLLKSLSRNELRVMASKARTKSVPDATDRVANQIEMLA
jgi:UDP-N-acetylglucosamine--N-acetylmuramyl-(pentapeptide) pyrophosphoryl-undecaprenol N-acetylglucosamine transferase